MIIDAHTHWPVCKDQDTSHLIGVLDRYQTDIAAVMGWSVLFKLYTMKECNNRLIEFCNKEPNRLLPIVTVHLSEEEKAIEEAERCIRAGARGFKFHPWLQGETVFCDTMYEICDLLGKNNVPLIFHDGTPPYSLPSQIGLLASMFPETTFVLGHGGILHFWEEAVQVAKQNDNVHVIICGSHPAAMQTICDTVDESRLLFGTDYMGQGTEGYLEYRKALIESLNLDTNKREKIMKGNAMRLFGISENGEKL